jgi:amidohydrolase
LSDPDLRQGADRLAAEIVGWRRDLHRHPELGFEEHRTAERVAERLRDLGLEVRTGVAGTGVLGLLRAGSASAPTPAVLLRADMDALPIQEIDGREYGSTVPGRMHACGHDGHVAMLLGAATLLSARRTSLTRDVLFCFQPAEEGLGGAERMIEDGALSWVEVGSAYALHLWSGTPAGVAQVRSGPMMAAQDEFGVRIVGRGGHGALPHLCRDPIVAAAQAVAALQAVVARAVDPIEAAVVTVGTIHAGTAPNVIPEVAEISGTLRSFTPAVRETLRQRVGAVFEGTARAGGCRAELELRPGFPAVVNDPVAVAVARQAARAVFGAAGVEEPAPLAAAEDFAYFLQKRPGAFLLVGARNEARGITASHHSPSFDIDESVLPRGAELLARLALHPGPP